MTIRPALPWSVDEAEGAIIRDARDQLVAVTCWQEAAGSGRATKHYQSPTHKREVALAKFIVETVNGSKHD